MSKQGEAKRNRTSCAKINEYPREYLAWRRIHSRIIDSKAGRGNYSANVASILEMDETIRTFDGFLSEIGRYPEDGRTWTVDRKDNMKGYVVGNLRWATPTMQARNRTTTVLVDWKGERVPFIDLIERLHGEEGLRRYNTYVVRLARGMTPEEALLKPVRGYITPASDDDGDEVKARRAAQVAEKIGTESVNDLTLPCSESPYGLTQRGCESIRYSLDELTDEVMRSVMYQHASRDQVRRAVSERYTGTGDCYEAARELVRSGEFAVRVVAIEMEDAD